MKISIDLDGTLWKHEDFFREFMLLMIAGGHEVGILTGHHHEHRHHDLYELHAKGFFPSFWIGRDPTNNPCTAYDKKKAIKDNNIAIHFDDCEHGNEESLRVLGAMSNVFIVK